MPGHDLSHLDSDVAALRAASLSPRTLEEYDKQWRQVVAWARQHGVDALPMPPADLARHLAAVSGAYSPASLAQRVAAVNAAHRVVGLPRPGDDPAVRQVMSGIRRTKRSRPRHAARALRLTELRSITATLDRQAQTWPSAISARRDAAVLLVGWAGALRRSELVALDFEDVTMNGDHLQVRITASKTDQEGAGEVLAIPVGSRPTTCAPCAVLNWSLLVSADGSEFLEMDQVWSARTNDHRCHQEWPRVHGPFLRPVTRAGVIGPGRLSGSSVGSILRRRARQADVDLTGLSAHSLRAGFITEADAAGAGLAPIMRQTRHRRPETVMGYIRHARPLAGNAVTSLDL